MSLLVRTIGAGRISIEGWVPAAPVRAWLAHLCGATGFDPRIIAAAADVPPSVGRSLSNTTRRLKRMRAIDAQKLLALDTNALLRGSQLMISSTCAHEALKQLGPLRPARDVLMAKLQITAEQADGLAGGWLGMCPGLVVWKCIVWCEEIMHQRLLQVSRDSSGHPTGQGWQDERAA